MHTAFPPKDQLDIKQGDQSHVQLTLHEIEHVIMNHSHEVISDFKKEVETHGKEFKNKLQLTGDVVLKAVPFSNPSTIASQRKSMM